MEKHFEVGLVAEAFPGGKGTSTGDVVRVDTNGHCWGSAGALPGMLEIANRRGRQLDTAFVVDIHLQFGFDDSPS